MRNTTPVWELISHLWFLLVLVVLTTVSLLIFSQLRQRASTTSSTFFANITGQAVAAVSCAGVAYAAIRRTLLIVYPPILSDGLFNFVVMQTLFYIPFFLIGALAFIHPRLKALFTTLPVCGGCCAGLCRLSSQSALWQRGRVDV